MSGSVENLAQDLDNAPTNAISRNIENTLNLKEGEKTTTPDVTEGATHPGRDQLYEESKDENGIETHTKSSKQLDLQTDVPGTNSIDEEVDLKTRIQNLQLSQNYGVRNAEKDAYKLAYSFGFQSHKRSNIHFVEENVIISSIGNLMVFYDLKSNEQRYVEGIRESSIGAIAVHPSRKFIAVGEVCLLQPNIYIYEYPSMEVYKILTGGATRGFADIAFNSSGTKIASVAIEPDFTLTVWNWENSSILLRSKAFSQDVYRVRFSADNDEVLTTSGMGHIKFWRMSTTFTGLKLQGYLGKFGASELSDIASFVQLPDGKVLSTTETGNFLLWDGGMIKCEIGGKGGSPCHQGKIEVMLMGDGEIVTAGDDGCVRVWDLETIDNADVVTAEGSGSSVATPRVFEIEPVDEIFVSKEVQIKCLIKNSPASQDFVIQDQNGQLLKYDSNRKAFDRYLCFHAGSVVGVCSNAVSDTMITLGSDGCLKCYNYITNSILTKMNFTQAGSCLVAIPHELDSLGTTVVAGFDDGVIRFVSISPKGGVLHYALKPCRGPIATITFSDDRTKMAVLSVDKTLFFFAIDCFESGLNPFTRKNVSVTPLGFIKLKEIGISLSFGAKVEKLLPSTKSAIQCHRLLLTTTSKNICEIFIPVDLCIDTSCSFEIPDKEYQIIDWKPDVPVYTEEVKAIDLIKSRQNLLSKDGGSAKSSRQNLRGTKLRQSEQNLSKPGLSASSSNLSDNDAALSKSKQNLFGDEDLKAAMMKLRPGLKVDSKFSNAVCLHDDLFIAAVINQNEPEITEIRLFKSLLPGFSLILGLVNGEVSYLSYDHQLSQLSVGTILGSVAIIKFSPKNLPFVLNGLVPKEWSKHESQPEFSARTEGSINDKLLNMESETANFAIQHMFDGQIWTGHMHDIINGKITGMSSSFDNSHLFTTGLDGGIFVWRNKYVASKDTLVDEDGVNAQLESAGRVLDIVESAAYSIEDEKIQSEKDKELGDAEKKKIAVKLQIAELRDQYQAILAENGQADSLFQLSSSELVVDPYLEDDIKRDLENKKELTRKELAWQAEKDSIGAKKLIEKFLAPLDTERIKLRSFRLDCSVSTFRCVKLDTISDLLTHNSHEILAHEAGRPETEKSSTPNLVTQHSDIKHPKNSEKFQATIKKLEARRLFKEERAALWKQLIEEKPDETYEDPKDLAAIKQATLNMGDYKLKIAPNYVVPENERVTADIKKRQIQLVNEGLKSLKKKFNDKFFKLRARKVQIMNLAAETKMEIEKLNEVMESFGIQESSPNKSFEFDYVLEDGLFPESRYVVSDKARAEQKEKELKIIAIAEKKGRVIGIGFGGARRPSFMPQSKLLQEIAAVGQQRSKPQLLSKKLSAAEKAQIIYRKEHLVEILNDRITEFDETLQLLYKESVLLSSDLKYAEIKLQVLFREWMILKEYEDTDNLLMEKLEKRKEEKQLIGEKIEAYSHKLAKKRLEIENVIKREREIHEEYRQAVGEDKNEEQLLKLFKQKVKKTHSPNDFDESDGSQLRMPQGCDPELWHTVMALRDSRLEQESLLSEIQISMEKLKSENDSLLNQSKEIEIKLLKAEDEVATFFTSKHQKLNELESLVPLRYSQIFHLPEKKLPNEFTDCVIFTNEGMADLKNRISNVTQEKLAIKKSHHALRKAHITLTNSKAQKATYLAEMTAKAEDVQMLKFGQLVDLEKLEKLGVNRQAEELKERLKREEIERSKRLAAKDAEIRQEKLLNYKVVEENTACLETLVDLKKQSQALTKSLDSVQSNLASSDLSGPTAKEILEKQKLQALVTKQTEEIKYLKSEIQSLIQKPTGKVVYRQKVSLDPIVPTAPSSEFLALAETALPEMSI